MGSPVILVTDHIDQGLNSTLLVAYMTYEESLGREGRE